MNVLHVADNQVGWDVDVPSDDNSNGNCGGDDVVMSGENNGGGSEGVSTAANAAGNPPHVVSAVRNEALEDGVLTLNHMR